MDNRTFELVINQPNNKWVWYECAKRHVPLYCAICLQRYLQSRWQDVFAGYDEYDAVTG